MTNKVSRDPSVKPWRELGISALGCLAMTALMGGASSEVLAQGANTPSQAQMWEIIQKQQRQIKRLQRVQGGGSAGSADSGEGLDDDTGAFDNDYGDAGVGWWTRTSIGGYGELHWNNGHKDEIDFHRFVLFVNHDFNDWIHFFSEFEIEHVIAGEGKNGEVEVEQA